MHVPSYSDLTSIIRPNRKKHLLLPITNLYRNSRFTCNRKQPTRQVIVFMPHKEMLPLCQGP